jgi:hypothetical protein
MRMRSRLSALSALRSPSGEWAAWAWTRSALCALLGTYRPRSGFWFWVLSSKWRAAARCALCVIWARSEQQGGKDLHTSPHSLTRHSPLLAAGRWALLAAGDRLGTGHDGPRPPPSCKPRHTTCGCALCAMRYAQCHCKGDGDGSAGRASPRPAFCVLGFHFSYRDSTIVHTFANCYLKLSMCTSGLSMCTHVLTGSFRFRSLFFGGKRCFHNVQLARYLGQGSCRLLPLHFGFCVVAKPSHQVH